MTDVAVAVPRSSRLLHLTAVLAGATAEALLLPGGTRRRQRLQRRTAARVLTALGARVDVVPPAVPWPRAGGLLVAGHDAGRLGDLALLTVLPPDLGGWSGLAERALPLPGAASGPPGTGTTLCPVAVTCRTASGPLDRVPGRVEEVAGLSGLVVEVRLLLPMALEASGQLGGAGTASGDGVAGTASGVGVAKVA